MAVGWAALGIAGAEPAPPVTLALSELRSLHSARTGLIYGVQISLPHDYAAGTRRYPVLYVLDGWHFPLMAFLANNSVYSGRMPPLIIVTLSHGTSDVMRLRQGDFTPTEVPDAAPSGGAEHFLGFLEHELIPFVEATYRADPTDRGLLGHSYGGLFACYALWHRPALFQRIVAASPMLQWDGGVLMQEAAARLAAGQPHARVDFSFGGDEGAEFPIAEVRAFLAGFDAIRPPDLAVRYTEYPGENHNSVRPFSFSSGLAWVYRAAAP